MLQVVCFKKVLQETKTIISFQTYEGNRVDFSKKFIKKTNDGTTYYFLKKSVLTIGLVTTIIYLGKTYIIETGDNASLTNMGSPILLVKDIISFTQVEAYNNSHSFIKETPRGAF